LSEISRGEEGWRKVGDFKLSVENDVMRMQFPDPRLGVGGFWK